MSDYQRATPNPRGYQPTIEALLTDPMVAALYNRGASTEEAADALAHALITAKKAYAEAMARMNRPMIIKLDGANGSCGKWEGD